MERFVPCFAVFALGFSAVVTQLVLLRELLSAFSGNEIGLGVMLGAWLLLMGLGSWAGRTAVRLKAPGAWFAWAQIPLALWPLVAVVLLRILRNIVFTRGVEVGVVETAIGCFVVLLPYCVVSGYLLALASVAPLRGTGFQPVEHGQDAHATTLEHGQDAHATPLGVGTVYFLDSVGSIAGGVVFTFVLVHFLSPFGALVVPAFLNLLAGAALGLSRRRVAVVAVSVVAGVGLAVALATCDAETATTRGQYPDARIAFTGHSPYGKLVVTEAAGQFNFFENGVPFFSTQNTEEVEEKVHYAMAQRPEARQVLLLSGGVTGTAKEILKYNVARVDYVELDPLIIEAGRKYVPENLHDGRIRVIAADARVYARETRERYGVVIVDVPEPSTSQLNRFYTREFYAAVNGVLETDGVLCFAAGEYADYVSPELARVIATVHTTLTSVFANVLIVPGDKVFYLASQGPLYLDIADRIEQAGVQPQWVKRQYLRTVLEPGRMADMQRAASGAAVPNEDFNPVLYYAHLRHWMSKFEARPGVVAACVAVVLALFLWRIRALPFAVFTAGFAASALEIVLLMGFQIVFGSVYHQLGVIITAFMAGLAVGSWVGRRRSATCQVAPRPGVMWLAFAIAAAAALMPLLLRGLGAATPLAHAGFVFMAFALAALVGLQFTLAGRDEGRAGSAASDLYTADFLGACLGALLASTLLIPLLGVTAVCELIGGMNLLGGVVVFLSGRLRPS